MKIHLGYSSTVLLAVFFLCVLTSATGSEGTGPDEVHLLGPQSTRASGEQHLLVVAVRFPDVTPKLSLQTIKKKVVTDLADYVKDQSYGRTWITPEFRGWVDLPDSIEKYSVSPNNFDVDRRRVRKLIEDTMTALGNVDFSQYGNILIVPGVSTIPGKGYGMMCYCANPGMLTGVRGNPRFVTLHSRDGAEFSGGVFVATENAPLGMLAHDFFHALGGVYRDKRLVPCLYNFERQAEASRKHEWEYCTNFVGPWDVMSAHYVKPKSPPPGISSFTRIRLGWISEGQIRSVTPGETAYVDLSPLEKSGDTLVVRIPLKEGQYYLLENRQPIGYDEILPDSGLLVLRVHPDAQEGAGTVEIMDANPRATNLSEATFRLDRGNRNLYMDPDNDVAVIPLWEENGKLGVLVTDVAQGEAAWKSAVEIQEMLHRRRAPHDRGTKGAVRACMDAFRRLDFGSCRERLQKM